MKKLLMIAALTCIAVSAVLAGGDVKKYTLALHGLTFESSAEFSVPAKAGLDALSALHPRKAKMGKEKLGIVAVLYTREAQKTMGMKDAGLLAYTRTTFMGAGKAGRPIERRFAGKKVKGEIVEKMIPSPMTVETYVLKLVNGSRVGICFNYMPEFTAEADRIINELSASMKE